MDVSGEPYLDLERQAQAMLAREERLRHDEEGRGGIAVPALGASLSRSAQYGQ